MPTVLGPRALIDTVVPTGVDPSEVFRFELADRTNPFEIVSEAAVIIGRLNEMLLARYGGLFFITRSLWARDRQGEGSRTMTPEDAEFTEADAVRSGQIGHMLPIKPYKDKVAWTQEYMMNGDRELLSFDIEVIAERWESRVDFELLTRMLTNTENAIGSAGWDVPWAIGTGVNVNYIPPAYRGYAHTSSHTHFVVKDEASANYDDLLEAEVVELRHHGLRGRPICLVAEADISKVMALTGFVKLVPTDMNRNAISILTALGEFEGIPGEQFGWYESKRGFIALFMHERIPVNYNFMTVTQGINMRGNGMAIRLPKAEDIGFGLRLDPQTDNSLRRNINGILFRANHGVGIWRRINGVAGYIDTGATVWVNPTIS